MSDHTKIIKKTMNKVKNMKEQYEKKGIKFPFKIESLQIVFEQKIINKFSLMTIQECANEFLYYLEIEVIQRAVE